jgi:hypothetical protein
LVEGAREPRRIEPSIDLPPAATRTGGGRTIFGVASAAIRTQGKEKTMIGRTALALALVPLAGFGIARAFC